MKRWLRAFAREVPEETLFHHVLAPGCFLWHVFTWGNVGCLEGEAAQQAFAAAHYEKILIFEGGYSHGETPEICKLRTVSRISEKELKKLSDVYIVDEDFTWTYVQTHEKGWIGPFFCRRKPFPWEKGTDFTNWN